jgi:hypothetical protein
MNLPFLKTRVDRRLAVVGKFEPTTSGNESSNHTTSFIHQLQKRMRLSKFFGSPVIAASGAIRLSRKDSSVRATKRMQLRRRTLCSVAAVLCRSFGGTGWTAVMLTMMSASRCRGLGLANSFCPECCQLAVRTTYVYKLIN